MKEHTAVKYTHNGVRHNSDSLGNLGRSRRPHHLKRTTRRVKSHILKTQIVIKQEYSIIFISHNNLCRVVGIGVNIFVFAVLHGGANIGAKGSCQASASQKVSFKEPPTAKCYDVVDGSMQLYNIQIESYLVMCSWAR